MASLTITVPDPQVPRVQAALGEVMLLGRDATSDEVRQFIVDNLKQVVRSVETQDAEETARATVVDIDATI